MVGVLVLVYECDDSYVPYRRCTEVGEILGTRRYRGVLEGPEKVGEGDVTKRVPRKHRDKGRRDSIGKSRKLESWVRRRSPFTLEVLPESTTVK